MQRIHSIDLVRGLVMVIMALDHVRDLTHLPALTEDPTNLATTTPFLFFTRWITHLCAPTFVFLSGTSAYLSLRSQQTLSENQKFLLSRGIWLVILEFTVVNFALWFDIYFRTLIFQVIAAIGCGFILLALLIRLPARVLGVMGVVIIAGHNLWQLLSLPPGSVGDLLRAVLIRPGVYAQPPVYAFMYLYPVVPWLGIMLLGFACGEIFYMPAVQRKRIFLRIGLGALLLFAGLRFLNLYGDPAPWSVQKNAVFTFLSFINTTKYAPSLLYTLMTLGCMCILLVVAERPLNRLGRVLVVYGKVPLFYYLVHWYIIHLVMFGMVFLQGFTVTDIQLGTFSFGRPAGAGVNLATVYAIWACIVAALYPLCRWYGQYKGQHRQKVWLRYL